MKKNFLSLSFRRKFFYTSITSKVRSSPSVNFTCRCGSMRKISLNLFLRCCFSHLKQKKKLFFCSFFRFCTDFFVFRRRFSYLGCFDIDETIKMNVLKRRPMFDEQKLSSIFSYEFSIEKRLRRSMIWTRRWIEFNSKSV